VNSDPSIQRDHCLDAMMMTLDVRENDVLAQMNGTTFNVPGLVMVLSSVSEGCPIIRRPVGESLGAKRVTAFNRRQKTLVRGATKEKACLLQLVRSKS